MAQILEFPSPQTNQVPDYTGRMLSLNPEKARKFQCGGFILSPNRMSSVVAPGARMAVIHKALTEGVLLDITDSKQDVKTEFSVLTAVTETETPDKVYFVRRQDIADLDLPYITDEDKGINDLVCVCTSDPGEQSLIEARIEETKRKLVLPPGMDNPEKYLIK